MYCRVLLCCMALFYHSSPKQCPWTDTESSPKYYSRQRLCRIYNCIGVLWTGDPLESRRDKLSLSFTKKCIVIISLLQFTHMNTNYATRSSIMSMSIMPGPKKCRKSALPYIQRLLNQYFICIIIVNDDHYLILSQ